MRILLVGHGRMGRLVASLAGEYGCTIAGIVDGRSAPGPDGVGADRWGDVEVAIDFSSPEAVMANVPMLVRRGINVVVGTTGWQKHEVAIRKAVTDSNAGLVAAP